MDGDHGRIGPSGSATESEMDNLPNTVLVVDMTRLGYSNYDTLKSGLYGSPSFELLGPTTPLSLNPDPRPPDFKPD